MTLRLRVVSDQRRSLGDRSTIIFTADGGTIGRSADNDWVLPDPLRYVSAHHARVVFRSGRYYLQDVTLRGAWRAPAALQLFEHAQCDVARLPVRGIVSASHFLTDLTLGLGEVVFDYVKQT